MNQNPLTRLYEFGQSFWWDSLSRRALHDGTIARMRDEDGMRGITSNPSIFQAAISKSNDYDREVAKLSSSDLDPESIFWELAVRDIRDACDLLAPVFEESDGSDGFVSLEVDPRLAYDAERTMKEVDHLWDWVDCENLMVKIPATKEGIPVIRAALEKGRKINVTLLFSRQAYREVMEAYLSALEARLAHKRPLENVASVASFFVSRLDTLVDAKLSEVGGQKAESLMGKAAVANAKLAYRDFLEVFSGERWEKLSRAGARVQRPLWASTSTKNPDYPDTLYVDPLVGKNTVNTIPTVTVDAYRDHGEPEKDAILKGEAESSAAIEEIEALGISLQSATDELLKEGVEKFERSFEGLLEALREKADAVG